MAVRSLARTRGFTLVALQSLAAGIGANTAVCSLLNGIWLRPLPYPGQERLVYLNTTAPKRDRAIVGVRWSPG